MNHIQINSENKKQFKPLISNINDLPFFQKQ